MIAKYGITYNEVVEQRGCGERGGRRQMEMNAWSCSVVFRTTAHYER